MATEFSYTHEEVGILLGVSRAQISNLLRLLNLDERIQHCMKQVHLSEGQKDGSLV